MENGDLVLSALKDKIIKILGETADADLLDYILKLLIAESR